MSYRLVVGMVLLVFSVQSQADWISDVLERMRNQFNIIDEYGRTLSKHEGHLSRNGDNGHTLRKHVYLYQKNRTVVIRNLTLGDLRNRCRSDFNQAFGGGAIYDIYRSKFNSYAEASDTAREMIKENRIGINSFQLMNASGAPSNTTYSIGKGRVVVQSVYDYWSNNAVNCNVSVLGKSSRSWWGGWKYYDTKRLNNARMEIKFNKSKNKMRWYINTVYPTI